MTLITQMWSLGVEGLGFFGVQDLGLGFGCCLQSFGYVTFGLGGVYTSAAGLLIESSGLEFYF